MGGKKRKVMILPVTSPPGPRGTTLSPMFEPEALSLIDCLRTCKCSARKDHIVGNLTLLWMRLIHVPNLEPPDVDLLFSLAALCLKTCIKSIYQECLDSKLSNYERETKFSDALPSRPQDPRHVLAWFWRLEFLKIKSFSGRRPRAAPSHTLLQPNSRRSRAAARKIPTVRPTVEHHQPASSPLASPLLSTSSSFSTSHSSVFITVDTKPVDSSKNVNACSATPSELAPATLASSPSLPCSTVEHHQPASSPLASPLLSISSSFSTSHPSVFITVDTKPVGSSKNVNACSATPSELAPTCVCHRGPIVSRSNRKRFRRRLTRRWSL